MTTVTSMTATVAGAVDRRGSVTTPHGFEAAGLAAGIKAAGKPDLALVVNRGPRRQAAAVFTGNRFTAAPVVWSREAVAGGELTAVVLNSGGANACTGAAGLKDSAETAERVAARLGCRPIEVGVCSTGLIGVRLPMDAVLTGVDAAAAALSTTGGPDAATAIMTTDTVSKTASLTSPDGWSIGGMAKGAGMLAPALATMLVVITTDADLPAIRLDRSLRAASARSFDRIDSDGCMSTNDAVLLMASGASGVSPDPVAFTEALTAVCVDLGAQLLADAEGSSHTIAITVRGASTESDALEVGREIARSNLFKCAVFGNDPNWGRVLAAAGTTRAAFDPDRVDVAFNGVTVFRAGGIGDDRSLVDLSAREVAVTLDLHHGDAAATVFTNDLTYAYVTENAEYSS